jgi:hypothetical protein
VCIMVGIKVTVTPAMLDVVTMVDYMHILVKLV